jgi:hypothetical protein
MTRANEAGQVRHDAEANCQSLRLVSRCGGVIRQGSIQRVDNIGCRLGQHKQNFSGALTSTIDTIGTLV